MSEDTSKPEVKPAASAPDPPVAATALAGNGQLQSRPEPIVNAAVAKPTESGDAGKSGAQTPPGEPAPGDRWERYVLYGIAVAVLAGLAHMYFSSRASLGAFQAGLHDHLTGDDGVPRLCGASVLLAEHALAETAGLRLVQLTMGAVLCIFGGLFVIRGVQAQYSLKANHGGVKSALETSSPGLVLITLAIVLMALATREQMKFSFTPPPMCLAGAYGISGGVATGGGGGTETTGVASPIPHEVVATAVPPDDPPPVAPPESADDGGE